MPLDTDTEHQTDTGQQTDTDHQEETETDLVLTVTPLAQVKVLELREGENDPALMGLRVEIVGETGNDFTYDLSFEAVASVPDGDHISTQGELFVIVPSGSVDRLRGAILDLPSNSVQGGLVIRNPNRPARSPDGPLELTGDLTDKLQQLIEQKINPMLDLHGGFATLVGVEGSRVFLTMGGGCHGCAMSTATLVDGIQVMVREALPDEVTEVIDVTDHGAGENPFYS